MSEEAVAEMEFFQEDSGIIDPHAVNRLAMLRLTNPTTGDSQTSPDPCTMCGVSVKKRSPFSSSLHEPNPKRPSLRPPTPNQTLFRCSSLPVDYPALNDVAALNPQFTKQASTSASLPPTLLRRTLSDPCPVSPPRSARKSKEISPNAKRLKRMQDRMKEMKKWCEELIQEEAEFEEDETHLHQLDAESNGSECEPIEAAWVEKTGESSIIHFKCPCGKDYQILLHDSNCYYMLMPFEQENCETETQEMLSVERNGEWLTIFTQCPCSKGYMILLSGKECYFKLIDNLSSFSH